jgi:hypothetical protein
MTRDEVHAANEQLQGAYHAMFAKQEGAPKIVMADLVAFCFGRKSTDGRDALETARNNGRREVLLRIQEFTNLTLEEIYALRAPPVRVRSSGDDE